jgi:murein DD-endopeptidase MepM/ murein hydrolase activator NlpD
MVPENVTSVPRAAQDLDGDFGRERVAQLRHGETFEALLRANGANREAASAILAAFGVKPGESPAAEGQKIILEYDSVDGSEKTRRVACVSVYADEQLKAKVAVDDRGQYAPVAIESAANGPQRAKRANEGENEGGINLYEALYETALKQGMPRAVIDELIKAFLNDVDFQRSVQPGDSLVAFSADPDEFESRTTLLYAALTVRDQTYRYYRFETPDDNVVDYYDENGRSSRKFLLRKPVAAGEMSSPFGMRYHPILHYARLHSGVDWVAPVGTPIVAAGNGTVLKAGYDSGYGRRVEIQHANGYVTTYNHMSAFARGIVPGAHVNQGQIVGYLGGSGLVTGPHLHYEVIINGNFVDPMAIKLARTREFDGKMLASFKKERDRIDQLMAQAPNASAAAPSPSVAARIN